MSFKLDQMADTYRRGARERERQQRLIDQAGGIVRYLMGVPGIDRNRVVSSPSRVQQTDRERQQRH